MDYSPVNEIFGEDYTGHEEIQFLPNEHFLDQQDKTNKERITDTNGSRTAYRISKKCETVERQQSRTKIYI